MLWYKRILQAQSVVTPIAEPIVEPNIEDPTPLDPKYNPPHQRKVRPKGQSIFVNRTEPTGKIRPKTKSKGR